MPIYHVKTPTGERLIKAKNQYEAHNFVARGLITVTNLSAEDAAEKAFGGMKLETAVPMSDEKTAAQ